VRCTAALFPCASAVVACENTRVNPWVATPAAIAAVAGVAAYGAVWPRAQLFGATVCRTNSPRKLAITFDDGPNPAITPKLLDLLDRSNAKATFFVIGAFARECPDLVREIAARGHVVGNHTETHPALVFLRPAEIQVELRLCHSAITNALGAPPKWFRPPFGVRNPWLASAARALDMRVVMWTLIPGDWSAPSAEWLIGRMKPIAANAERLAKNTTGTGDILCLHDGGHRAQNVDRTRTLAALEHWLPRWRDLGLEFVTINDAVRAPAS
jgi:peptidoglycan/xylan/chitin deacetylase (PgdA/CDA1 family)